MSKDSVATAVDGKNGQPELKKAKTEKIKGLTGSGHHTVASVEERDFDDATQRALDEIDGNQNEIDCLNEKASEEILQVEQKYNKLRRPFYNKRNEIIRRIPNFWLTAFINHPQLTLVIEPDDEDCLRHLVMVDVEEFDDIKSGYRIKFEFDSANNPYFSNKELVKEFMLTGSRADGTAPGSIINGVATKNGLATVSPAMGFEPKSTATAIDWKEGYDLVAKSKQRSAENKKKAISESGADIKGADAQESEKKRKRRFATSRTFFAWFLDNSDPAADDIAEIIRDDIWPSPLQYFLVTEVVSDDDDEDDDEDDEDDEESDSDTEGGEQAEDDEDDDEEDEKCPD